MQPIESIKPEYLRKLRLICMDADGVTKKKGTEFVIIDNKKVMQSFGVVPGMMRQLKELNQVIRVLITSGRKMDYLQSVYGDDFILQSEIGMFTFNAGIITANTDLTVYENFVLNKIRSELEKLKTDKRVKGFEPKDRIITLHCFQEVAEVRPIVERIDGEQEIDCWWNGEAYDILPKRIDKGFGLRCLLEKTGISLGEVMTVGNGINDQEMISEVGVSVSTDPKHLQAAFFVEVEERGGQTLVELILRSLRSDLD